MEDVQKLIQETIDLIKLGEYQKALKCLDRVCVIDNAEFHFLASLIYHRLRDRGSSGRMIIKCLLTDPCHEKALFLLQHLFYRAGRLNISVSILKRCLIISPKSVFLQGKFSHRLAVSGQQNQSVLISKKALLKNKKEFEGWFNFAKSLESAGQLKESLDTLVQIKKKFKFNKADEVKTRIIDNQIRNLIIEIIAKNWCDTVDFKSSLQRLTITSMLSITKGFRHDIIVSEKFSTFQIGGIMDNSPVVRNDFNLYLSQLIFSRIPIKKDARIIDVGGADGFFAIEAARRGAQVKMIEPGGFFYGRAQIFSKIYDVEQNLCVEKALLSPTHLNELKKSDIIFALGLVYHFDNLVEDLDLLLESRSIIVFESVGSFDIIWNEEDAWSYKFGKEFSLKWFCDHIRASRYEIEFVPEWNIYCSVHTKKRRLNVTRQLFIARPHKEVIS